MTSTAAMEAGSASVERLLAAAVATMEKARYCWAMTVAEDGSVNARPMGPQKSPASEDPFGILFLTRRGSRKALEIGRTLRHFIPHPPRFPQGAGDRPYRPAERGLST